MLETGDTDLWCAVATALVGLGDLVQDKEKALVRTLLSSAETVVVTASIRAVWTWREIDGATLANLLTNASVKRNAHLAEDVALALAEVDRTILETISRENAVRFLRSLETVPELNSYWINEVLAELSFRFPFETSEFFVARVELAAASQSFELRAANPRPYSQKRLRFLESLEGPVVLERMWDWLNGNRDRDFYFEMAAMDVFEAMFLFDDRALVEFIDARLDASDCQDLKLMSRLLRKTHHDFIFNHPAFISRFLDRCRAEDPDILESSTTELFAGAVSGLRSGIPGEPMPRDIQDLDRAETILTTLSRVSPAHRLYELVRKAARASIKDARLDGEIFDT